MLNPAEKRRIVSCMLLAIVEKHRLDGDTVAAGLQYGGPFRFTRQDFDEVAQMGVAEALSWPGDKATEGE